MKLRSARIQVVTVRPQRVAITAARIAKASHKRPISPAPVDIRGVRRGQRRNRVLGVTSSIGYTEASCGASFRFPELFAGPRRPALLGEGMPTTRKSVCAVNPRLLEVRHDGVN